MPLRHVLYRCPLCGHDPTKGQGDAATCTACRATFTRAQRGVDVGSGGELTNHTIAELVDRIRAHGGPLTAATAGSDQLIYRSIALYHGLVKEDPVRRGGRLVGWVERPPPPVEGFLEVTDEELGFRAVGIHELRWPLDTLTALQVSTRSLQIGVRYVGTVQLTFPEASTYRWEELLQHLVREAWRRRGRGEITEFQPRITGR